MRATSRNDNGLASASSSLRADRAKTMEGPEDRWHSRSGNVVAVGRPPRLPPPTSSSSARSRPNRRGRVEPRDFSGPSRVHTRHLSFIFPPLENPPLLRNCDGPLRAEHCQIPPRSARATEGVAVGMARARRSQPSPSFQRKPESTDRQFAWLSWEFRRFDDKHRGPRDHNATGGPRLSPG